MGEIVTYTNPSTGITSSSTGFTNTNSGGSSFLSAIGQIGLTALSNLANGLTNKIANPNISTAEKAAATSQLQAVTAEIQKQQVLILSGVALVGVGIAVFVSTKKRRAR